MTNNTNFNKNSMTELMEMSKTLKVLYAEDNKEARNQTVKLLSNFFNEIGTASDGAEAFEKFSTENYDIIISDINMPVMNGIELLKKVREKDKEIPFLLFTAHNDRDYFLDSISYNVDGYLAKPVTLEAIVIQMNKTVKNLTIKREHESYRRKLENLNDELEHKVALRTRQIKMRMDVDDLTRINSRHALVNRLKNLVDGHIPVIILIDIQSFKLFNELYGLEIGNEILIRFAKMLENHASLTNYSLYRVSGDEFVLFEEVRQLDEKAHTDFAYKLCDFMKSQAFHLKQIDETITLSITIGLSFSRENPLGKADMALNRSKELGTSVTVYKTMQDMEQRTKDTLYWKEEITSALKQDRIIPYLQGIHNKDGEPVKYELLMRLMQNKNGVMQPVSPVHFLDIAYKTGRYSAISFRVIKTALNLLRNKNISLSININYTDLTSPDMINLLHESLGDYFNTDQKTIILEVLEHDNIADYKQFSGMLKILRDSGAKIAIDDFGSGYSNFTHIAGLNPDYLKIDSSLIKNIADDEKSRKIAKGLVRFASELGIKTIAEFVYSKEVFEAALSIGVDEFQGYYFSEPLPLISFLEKQ